jgi:glycerophosphoryl diester phosphodiesterase
MVLVSADGNGYIHVGSINGTEQSSKGNRELALQIQSNALFNYLAAMFEADWPHRIYLPLIFNSYIGATNHVVISEVLYNPPGAVDDAEYIELANPTGQTIDISGYLLGDAVGRDDFEDVRRFPPGTLMPARTTLVIAVRADAFSAEYNVIPDFEILDSDSNVPDLIDDLDWGDPATYLQLGNNGDEIILRSDGGTIVDAIAYGTGHIDGVISCDLVTIAGRGLARVPYWRDTDDCSADFQLDSAPTPGILPQ